MANDQYAPQLIEVTDAMVAVALAEFHKYIPYGRVRLSEDAGMKAAIAAALAARVVTTVLPGEGGE